MVSIVPIHFASASVRLAEQAVAASPRDGSYRALLGQAYLNDGRFASATAALGEAMDLGVKDSNTVIALTLAHIAQGQKSAALEIGRALRRARVCQYVYILVVAVFF